MKIVVALDSFKGSVSSAEGGAALAAGLREADPSLSVAVVPVADGGEGTVEAVREARGGELVAASTTDPRGRPIEASFLLIPELDTAVIELARASGLTLLREEERDPLVTSTLGTGILVRRAIDAGARRIILAVGGSATNDGGTGVARALGVVFAGAGETEVAPAGAALAEIESIDTASVPPAVREAEFVVATDVRNPLCGRDGAAFVYAPQKGAGEAAVERLDTGLRNLARRVREAGGVDVTDLPGAGAAGGVAACLAGLFGARIVSGFDAVAELIRLPEAIAGGDLVVTGEGKLDGQTLSGKVVLGIARLARPAGIPVFAVAGLITREAEALTREGVVGFFPIAPGPISLERSMREAAELLRATGRRIGYLLPYLRGRRGAE